MAFVKISKNKHGTEVAVFNCEECGDQFNVCPSPDIKKYDEWKYCLSETCNSYSPDRDADILFMSNDEIAREKKIVSIRKLIERKDMGE